MITIDPDKLISALEDINKIFNTDQSNINFIIDGVKTNTLPIDKDRLITKLIVDLYRELI